MRRRWRESLLLLILGVVKYSCRSASSSQSTGR
jgi:hypothetical protein